MKINKILLYLQYIALLDLKGKDYKVFLYMLPILSSKNPVKISQKDIAYEMHMSKSEVSKAIKNLVASNLLIVREDSIYTSKNKELLLNHYSQEDLEDRVTELSGGIEFLEDE